MIWLRKLPFGSNLGILGHFCSRNGTLIAAKEAALAVIGFAQRVSHKCLIQRSFAYDNDTFPCGPPPPSASTAPAQSVIDLMCCFVLGLRVRVCGVSVLCFRRNANENAICLDGPWDRGQSFNDIQKPQLSHGTLRFGQLGNRVFLGTNP